MNAGDAGEVNGPTDEREHVAGDAVEQVQRAVLTVIGAARVVLDTIEAVGADRGRLDDLAARGRGVVNSVLDPLFGGHGHPDAGAPTSGERDTSRDAGEPDNTSRDAGAPDNTERGPAEHDGR
jgi:hypothetical protein